MMINDQLGFSGGFLSVGGELLPGHEPDCSHFTDVPERGGCILGPVSASHQPEACHAW